MPRNNRVSTVKLSLSLDATMDRVLEDLASAGILGKNKAEVAVGILWKWIWDNEDRLQRQGVSLVAKRSRKGGR
jgi:hypothetical protein